MKAIFKMNVDCGRGGSLQGVFIADEKVVDYMIKKEVPVYFGEVLGKHSDVCGAIEEKEIKIVSKDENVIKVIEDNKLTSGYNPINTSLGYFDLANENVDTEVFSDWTVGQYIEWKLNKVYPDWVCAEYKEVLITSVSLGK